LEQGSSPDFFSLTPDGEDVWLPVLTAAYSALEYPPLLYSSSPP
jgi:hypothetical protein